MRHFHRPDTEAQLKNRRQRDKSLCMTSPRTLLKAWNLQPKKQLGQNFLADPSTADMIVNRAGIKPEETVLEIGAGLGALTIPAARAARKIYAVETDDRLIGLLETELLAHGIPNAAVLKQDILRFDLKAFIRQEAIPDRLVVLGNLPYNISSQVVVRLIHAREGIARAAMMFQRELALRLLAEPGGKDYGRLTAMLRYCADVEFLARVNAPLFYPRPKVDSEVLMIRFRETPAFPAEDERFLFQVIKAAFGQRRKNIKNALSGSDLQIRPDTARSALKAANIDPIRRAETLTIPEFVELSRRIQNRR
jgi:16S rRNA (adenine1518-N6/adenine1519-N6)-dimethyltransferase